MPRIRPLVLLSVLAGLAWFLFLSARPIVLATADLGRHIANGRTLFSDPAVLTQNFYSYTHPDAPFFNHHWGTGVVFYLVQQLGGFPALSILQLALGVIALVAIGAAHGRAPRTLLAGALLWSIPLLASRVEVRPETFSLAFTAVFYFLVLRAKKIDRPGALYALPFLMALWVNLHVYFFFGFAVIGAFFLQEILEAGNFRAPRVHRLAATLVACLAATLVNPMGYRLVLVPLTMFQNYGYRVAENQSVFFLWGYGIRYPVFYLLPVLALICGAALGAVAWLRRPVLFAPTLLFLFFTATMLVIYRNVSFAGLFAVPFLAVVGSEIQARRPRAGRWLGAFVLASALAANAGFYALDADKAVGIGLATGAENSAEFFRATGLRGPIFNNYDIGSFLIYELFPRERVFVDNRPEAYPAAFFTEEYIPMQEREELWRSESLRRGFNVIYFFWRDLTPWAQGFLVRRTQDPEWVPVFVDDYALILVRNVDANRAVIDRFQIPRDRFGTHGT